ncbi:MAG: WYL domain-containing protein [Bacteroidales bacterium]|nr:WYL domain-containing protein [Bacteroidales bacterium]
MSKNLINRYIWLVDTIYQAGSTGITLREISDKWEKNWQMSGGEEYPRRTFMHHKSDILDIFGIEIGCHKFSNSYYIVDSKDISDSSGFRRWMFETMSVNNHINENAQLRDRILLEDNPSGGAFLSTILEAMRDGKMITFDYKPFWANEDRVSRLYHVEPYALKVFKRRWYLLARYGDSQLKIYALDRFQDIDIEFESYSMPANFDASDYFYPCFGIILSDEEPQSIKLKVSNYQANYLRSLPLHHSQKEEEHNDSYSIFTYHLRPTLDFIQELLSLGETTEVLQPISLRKEIARICRSMAKNNSTH